MRAQKKIVIAAGVLVLLLAGAVAFYSALKKSSPKPLTIVEEKKAASPKIQLDSDLELLAKNVEKAVVGVYTEQIDKDAASRTSSFNRFSGFGGAYPGSKRKILGSGFVVSSNGYILTNSHIVESAARIQVKLNDNRMMSAVVLGTDPKSDLAILKISDAGLPALRWARSNQVKTGELVAAFGCSYGDEPAMAGGIISAKGRILGSDAQFLFTDAAISRDNSGGPLINLQGEVIGVNTIRKIPNSEGIGFAIPSETAQRVFREITKSRSLKRGWIGARVEDVLPEIGALIDELAPDGPAYAAGLRPGDLIVQYNDVPVRTSRDLSVAVSDTPVGSSVQLRLFRKNREATCRVLIGERPSSIAQRFISPRHNNHGKLGITIEDITPAVQVLLRLSSNEGALVVEVDEGSAADYGGIHPGDVIHQINRMVVHQANDLISAVRSLDDESAVILGVERQGSRIFLSLQPQ
jgi:serine protease Do